MTVCSKQTSFNTEQTLFWEKRCKEGTFLFTKKLLYMGPNVGKGDTKKTLNCQCIFRNAFKSNTSPPHYEYLTKLPIILLTLHFYLYNNLWEFSDQKEITRLHAMQLCPLPLSCCLSWVFSMLLHTAVLHVCLHMQRTEAKLHL